MESWSHISRSTLLATFTGQKDMDSRQIQLPTPWCHLLSVPCTSMRSGRGFPTAAKRIANRLGRQVERTKLPTCTEGLPVDHDCCGPEVIYQPGTEPMELALRTQERPHVVRVYISCLDLTMFVWLERPTSLMRRSSSSRSASEMRTMYSLVVWTV